MPGFAITSAYFAAFATGSSLLASANISPLRIYLEPSPAKQALSVDDRCSIG
jgi:hypothetical protein